VKIFEFIWSIYKLGSKKQLFVPFKKFWSSYTFW